MKFNLNKNILLIVLVTLAIITLANCGKWKTTGKKSWNNGDIFALTHHYLACPAKHGMTHFQAQKSGNNFWFKYQCYGGCKGLRTMTKSYNGQTGLNATDGNKKKSLHYLDRHNVQCKNGYSLNSFGLKRLGGKIQYKFKCVETKCSKRSTLTTSSQNMGANETKYFPRLLAKIPKFHHVLTGFHFHRRHGNYFHFKVHYCELNHKFKTPKKPTKKPAKKPTKKPAKKPTKKPAAKPAKKPTKKPSAAKPIPKVSKLPARPAAPIAPAAPAAPTGPAPIGPSSIVGSAAYKDDIPTVAALTPAATIAEGKGAAFCAKHCVVNFARRTRQCLLANKYYDCKRCVMNPALTPNTQINSICETVCDSVGMNRPCDFFGYYNGAKKKNVSGAALKKFGLALIRRR